MQINVLLVAQVEATNVDQAEVITAVDVVEMNHAMSEIGDGVEAVLDDLDGEVTTGATGTVMTTMTGMDAEDVAVEVVGEKPRIQTNPNADHESGRCR